MCTSYCESVLPHCVSFFDELRNFGTFDNFHPLDIPTNCTSANSVPKDRGTVPECYDQITLTGQIINGSKYMYMYIRVCVNGDRLLWQLLLWQWFVWALAGNSCMDSVLMLKCCTFKNVFFV